MRTTHQIMIADSTRLDNIASGSVHLVVTSPPYPMIAMWDEGFGRQDPRIGAALAANDGRTAFALMHERLDLVWAEVARVLVPGGIACINIGDATRTIGGVFQVYANHARIIQAFTRLGLVMLPEIIWRKPTNAPNKFMGSGMLPPGAYVTQEHEYILIFRQGGKRTFPDAEARENRHKSAYFWEERNQWFSDIWDMRGTRQTLTSTETRARSAAFPLEIPYRLINMYSVKGDTVLDPFLGTGTTSVAALAAQRHSLGVELDPGLRETILANLTTSLPFIQTYIRERIDRHRAFAAARTESSAAPGYTNGSLGVPVVTAQEVALTFSPPTGITRVDDLTLAADYAPLGADAPAVT